MENENFLEILKVQVKKGLRMVKVLKKKQLVHLQVLLTKKKETKTKMKMGELPEVQQVMVL